MGKALGKWEYSSHPGLHLFFKAARLWALVNGPLVGEIILRPFGDIIDLFDNLVERLPDLRKQFVVQLFGQVLLVDLNFDLNLVNLRLQNLFLFSEDRLPVAAPHALDNLLDLANLTKSTRLHGFIGPRSPFLLRYQPADHAQLFRTERAFAGNPLPASHRSAHESARPASAHKSLTLEAPEGVQNHLLSVRAHEGQVNTLVKLPLVLLDAGSTDLIHLLTQSIAGGHV